MLLDGDLELGLRLDEARDPLDGLFALLLDALQQYLASGDIVNQTHDGTSGPDLEKVSLPNFHVREINLHRAPGLQWCTPHDHAFRSHTAQPRKTLRFQSSQSSTHQRQPCS